MALHSEEDAHHYDNKNQQLVYLGDSCSSSQVARYDSREGKPELRMLLTAAPSLLAFNDVGLQTEDEEVSQSLVNSGSIRLMPNSLRAIDDSMSFKSHKKFLVSCTINEDIGLRVYHPDLGQSTLNITHR